MRKIRATNLVTSKLEYEDVGYDTPGRSARGAIRQNT